MASTESTTEAAERAARKGEGSDEALLALARKRFTRAYEACQKNRNAAREVRKFVWLDEQWGNEAAKRNARGQSVITVNELKALFHQVANDQRQNRPSPRVVPVDSGADPEVARVFNGLVRRILAGSGVGPNADAAFDTAHGHAVDGGEGFFYLETAWEDDEGTMQCIRVARVDDPESVLVDPGAREADGSDAEWAFISTWMDEEALKQRWPRARPVDWEGATPEHRQRWVNEGRVRVCRYRYVSEEPGGKKDAEGNAIGRPARRVGECLMTGADVLERTEFPCRWLGVMRVVGDEAKIAGEVYTSGLFHSARGPQMMKNYYRSSLADAVGQIPKSQWKGTPAMFKGFEKDYDGAGARPVARLMYNVDPDAQGKEPEQVYYRADVTALVTGAELMQQDIERVTGIFAAGRGEESNEKSGKALLARQHETDTATFHYADNFARALEYMCRCIVDMIPRVYAGDDARPTRILEEDGSDRVIYFRHNEGDLPVVVEEIVGPATAAQQPRLRKGERLEAGERRAFTYIDPDVGRYDVQIATGPSFSTKRRENAEALTELAQGAGEDYLLIRYMASLNMDWEGAAAYRDALLLLMPEPLAAALKDSAGGAAGGAADADPKTELRRVRGELGQAQEQLEQMGAALQQFQAALQQALAAANDAERERMVKLAIAQIGASWQRYEADQATVRVALEQGGESVRTRRAGAARMPGAGGMPGTAMSGGGGMDMRPIGAGPAEEMPMGGGGAMPGSGEEGMP